MDKCMSLFLYFQIQQSLARFIIALHFIPLHNVITLQYNVLERSSEQFFEDDGRHKKTTR